MKTIYPFMGLALCGIAAQAQEKPNFLIIQCDHLTQRVVGAYGHTQGCTLEPNIVKHQSDYQILILGIVW